MGPENYKQYLGIRFVLQAGASGHAVWGIGLHCLVAEIVDSNPAYCMEACLSPFCVGRGLESGWSVVQGILPVVEMIHNFRSNSELEQLTRPNPYSCRRVVRFCTSEETQHVSMTTTSWLMLFLFLSRLCHYSVGGAWWHLGFYESF
jgi:hypothetical protein